MQKSGWTVENKGSIFFNCEEIPPVPKSFFGVTYMHLNFIGVGRYRKHPTGRKVDERLKAKKS